LPNRARYVGIRAYIKHYGLNCKANILSCEITITIEIFVNTSQRRRLFGLFCVEHRDEQKGEAVCLDGHISMGLPERRLGAAASVGRRCHRLGWTKQKNLLLGLFSQVFKPNGENSGVLRLACWQPAEFGCGGLLRYR